MKQKNQWDNKFLSSSYFMLDLVFWLWLGYLFVFQNQRKLYASHETMKNWKVKLAARRQRLAEVINQRGIVQNDLLWPLLFVVAMMLLNYRKCSGGYKSTKWREKINYLMYMDYMYLGILHADTMKQAEGKEQKSREPQKNKKTSRNEIM